MIGKATQSSRLLVNLLRGFFPLALMVLCWTWGEWLGYLTGRRPARLTVAPEIDG
jgi:hypothetical protein